MSRSLTAALGTAVAATLLDPTRIVVTSLLLRKARRDNPELFDGTLASAAVNAALAEEVLMTPDYMVVGTLVTGFFVIRAGTPDRLSPVFHTKGEARRWLTRMACDIPNWEDSRS